jgi:hypothetical protein
VSRLVAAELRRIAARRLVRVVLLLAIVGVLVGGVISFVATDSLSEDAYRERIEQVDAERRDADQRARECLAKNGVDVEAPGPIPDEIARACLPNGISVHDPRFRRSDLKGVLQGVTGVLIIAGWLLGASLVGAEFASRSMTTTLTWETRRGRVFAAKAGAVAVATAAMAAFVLALAAAAMLPALLLHHAPVGPGDPSVATLAGTAARGVILTTLAAAIGFAIATIGRSTAAALGAGFAYIVILENIIGGYIPRWRRWLLLGNVIVFVSGENEGGDVPGRTVTSAGLFLAAVALALLIGAVTAFRARDIA